MPFKNRTSIIKLAALLTSTLVGLFIAEGMLRLVKPAKLSITQQPCIYVKDERIGHRYRPHATGRKRRGFEIDTIVRTNSMGFHDIERDPGGGEEALRIVAIGDSFTAALNVGVSEGWTQTLERELRATGHGVAEVINLGLGGTGTDVHLDILKQYLPVFQPDMVMLAFYRNDIKDISNKRKFVECYRGYVITFQDEGQRSKLTAFVDAHKPSRLSSWLFDNLYLYRVAARLFRGGVLLRTNYLSPSRVGIAVDEKAASTVDVEGIFREYISLSQEHDFEFLVVPIPPKNDISGSLEALRENVAGPLLAQLEIVDVAPLVRELLMEDGKAYNELFWIHDAHLNVYGNRIFGLAVAKVVNGRLRDSPSTR